MRKRTRLVLPVLGLLLLQAPAVLAQRAPSLATREQLQELVSTGRNGASRLSSKEVDAIRARLAAGDFQPGDRLILRVLNDTGLTDTFTVKAGPEVSLPNMDPLPLAGVLRSELEDRVREHISRFIRDPQVEATSLIRIGLLGAVARPGYYTVAPDMQVGQVVPQVSGVAADGDLTKTTILRGGQERWSRNQVRTAMSQGISLDKLGVQSGDEIAVGRRSGGIGPTLTIVTGVVGLAATIVLLTRN